MSTAFPISDTGIPAPNWIGESLVPSETAGIETSFINGGKSFLQLTEVPTGGSIEIHWDRLSPATVNKFLDFWHQVGKNESITLPNDFFRPEWPPDNVALFKKLSPTGFWKFTEKPKIDRHFLHEYSIRATLEAILI